MCNGSSCMGENMPSSTCRQERGNNLAKESQQPVRNMSNVVHKVPSQDQWAQKEPTTPATVCSTARGSIISCEHDETGFAFPEWDVLVPPPPSTLKPQHDNDWNMHNNHDKHKNRSHIHNVVTAKPDNLCYKETPTTTVLVPMMQRPTHPNLSRSSSTSSSSCNTISISSTSTVNNSICSSNNKDLVVVVPTHSTVVSSLLLSTWDEPINDTIQSLEADNAQLQHHIQMLESHLEWLQQQEQEQQQQQQAEQQQQQQNKQPHTQTHAIGTQGEDKDDNNGSHDLQLQCQWQAQYQQQEAMVDSLIMENRQCRVMNQTLLRQLMILTDTNLRLATVLDTTRKYNVELQQFHIHDAMQQHEALLRQWQGCQKEEWHLLHYELPRATMGARHERILRKLYIQTMDRIAQYFQHESFDRMLLAAITEMPPPVMVVSPSTREHQRRRLRHEKQQQQEQTRAAGKWRRWFFN